MEEIFTEKEKESKQTRATVRLLEYFKCRRNNYFFLEDYSCGTGWRPQKQ